MQHRALLCEASLLGLAHEIMWRCSDEVTSLPHHLSLSHHSQPTALTRAFSSVALMSDTELAGRQGKHVRAEDKFVSTEQGRVLAKPILFPMSHLRITEVR